MKIDVFIPCCIDQFAPQTGFRLLELLKSTDTEVKYNPEQTCCGEIFFRSGDFDTAKKLGTQFMENFKSSDYIVSASPACVSFVRNYFEELFYNSSAHNQCKEFINKTYDIADFLVNIVNKTAFNAILIGKAVLVENRGIRNLYNQRKELTELLSNVKGLELIEIPEFETLPGSDIHFANDFTPIADDIMKRFLQRILHLNTEIVISNDMRTILNIESYCRKQNISLKCMHIADVLTHDKND